MADELKQFFHSSEFHGGFSETAISTIPETRHIVFTNTKTYLDMSHPGGAVRSKRSIFLDRDGGINMRIVPCFWGSDASGKGAWKDGRSYTAMRVIDPALASGVRSLYEQVTQEPSSDAAAIAEKINHLIDSVKGKVKETFNEGIRANVQLGR